MQKPVSIIHCHTKESLPKDGIEPTRHAFEVLEIHKLIHIKPLRLHGQQKRYHVMDFFVTDPATIHHRMQVFDDLLNMPEVAAMLEEILPTLSDMADMHQDSDEGEGSLLQHFYYARRLELYVDTITKIYEVMNAAPLSAQGLQNFAKAVADEYHSEAFQNLKINLAAYLRSVKHIKSITVGVNLNNQLKLDDLGIVSVNEEYFTGGSFMEKLLTANLSHEPKHTFITHCAPVIKGLPTPMAYQVTKAFNTAINTVIKKATGSIKTSVVSSLKAYSDRLHHLLPEISFLLAGLSFLTAMKTARVPLCKPEASANAYGAVAGLLNPHLLHSKATAAIVPNDVTFDENGMIYILTGANSGGKTVYLNALGVAQILYQLGLPIPAQAAVLPAVENIHVHFPIKDTMQSSKGRLEQECATLSETLKLVTPGSLVLMDETFSSTSAGDGRILAEEVLKSLSAVGCKCVFSTHIHELAQQVETLNQDRKAKGKLDNLTVATDGSGNRMYKVLRQKPDGASHAKDIARKYGLVLEDR